MSSSARAERLGRPPGIFLLMKWLTCSFSGAGPTVAGGAAAEKGPVKILTSCPSCLQGLSRYTGDLTNGLLEADYIVVEMANRILGEDWMPEYVARANEGGIERVLV